MIADPPALVTAPNSPILTLAELEAFDVGAPPGRKERRFCCPLPACADKPRDAAHRALSLNTSTGEWHCHRCTAGGQLREYWAPRPPDRYARRAALRRAFGLTDAALPMLPPVPESLHMPAGLLLGSDGEHYLARRGISVDLAAAIGVQFVPAWYGRPAVLFPITDQAGTVVAAQGRYIDGDAVPKARTRGTLTSGVFVPPGVLLADPLAIVEAPIDALSLAVCGVAALALCGTSWPAWLPKVVAFRQVYVALDADAAGDAAAASLTAALVFGSKVERLRPCGGKDWNELLLHDGAERLRRQLFDRYAGPRYAAIWQRLRGSLDGQSPPALPLELAQAIDTADWGAFSHALQAYDAAARTAVADAHQLQVPLCRPSGLTMLR